MTIRARGTLALATTCWASSTATWPVWWRRIALDAAAVAAGGVGFPELDVAAQDTLLARVEAGDVSAELARCFALLVAHTMEGYYSDPGNGGNRDAVSWRMIGFEVRG
jgi:hypothetical protein